ncbi:MAG: C45 family autoproteolytic acyltransferase/hydrolase [Candidatus Acidiferrales bacterium]
MQKYESRFIPIWLALVILCALTAAAVDAGARRSAPPERKISAQTAPADARLAGSYRFDRGGWVYVHLQGSPEQIGFQHGYLLAPEIKDAFEAVKLTDTHEAQRDWNFFRDAAHRMLWPHIDAEYQQELRGIAAGLQAKGLSMDIDDVVALNAFEELPDYYVPWLNAKEKVAGAPRLQSPGNCSAFIATGSWTKDHQIVIAHNNWTSYLHGERWRIVFDIVPQNGFRMIGDGFPGVITSDDDFAINSDGIMITETTITQFHGWDPDGKPEFVRSRKALQYASSIDDYVRIISDGNNGGYANDWLLGDRKTGEIAQLELGLKHTKLWRTKDGYFAGSNFASDPQVLKDDTTFDPTNAETSPNARRARWEDLLKNSRGKIDVDLAEKFLSDHYDTYSKTEQADQRTLCGHGDVANEGLSIWGWGPHYPGGAVQGKVADSRMAELMTFVARIGHPCGEDFHAAPFLAAHPEYSWQKPLLRDMLAGPWTEFHADERAAK